MTAHDVNDTESGEGQRIIQILPEHLPPASIGTSVRENWPPRLRKARSARSSSDQSTRFWAKSTGARYCVRSTLDGSSTLPEPIRIRRALSGERPMTLRSE